MNEPTVLDYLKSIFKNRDSFKDFLKAVFDRKDTTEMPEFWEAPASEPTVELVTASGEISPAPTLRRFPWLTLAVLLLALAGQQLFEPPQQLYNIGIILYVAAFGLLLLAFRRGEWSLTPSLADDRREDTFSVRGIAFVVSLILSALTFYKMSDNRFTAFNLTLWAATIAFHLWAFWVREPRTVSTSPKAKFNFKEYFTSGEWNIRITRWGLIVFAIIALTLFFRTYRLSQVPNEMTSDHAEKLMDVYDITQGLYSIYFPRNTGREPMYIYLSALVSHWFGVSFLTLKIVAVFGGLMTLPFIYLLGKELGGKRIGLIAIAFAGIGYWPSVIERFGLRISFYPLFAAATLYFFFRGLRRQKRNDFILAGVALGMGLNGYTPFRIMPIALVVMFLVYFLHLRDANSRKQAMVWFGLLAFTSWVFVIPLARFAVDRPDIFVERAFSRVGTLERPFPAPVWQLFLHNLWVALREFNWYNGNIWVHSIPGRPALDVVSGALFLIGVAVVLIRYIRNRHWKDVLLLLSVPLLQMPSILSLAFPEENPSLNRTGGALVPVFLLVGVGLNSLLNGFFGQDETSENSNKNSFTLTVRSVLVSVLTLGLFVGSFAQNFHLVFTTYYEQYRFTAWNTHDMGNIMKDFVDKGGSPDNVWIIPYSFWVDTRLPPFWAGFPGRDIAIAPNNIAGTLAIPGAKVFMVDMADDATIATLETVYPDGKLTILHTYLPQFDFYVFRVPATN